MDNKRMSAADVFKEDSTQQVVAPPEDMPEQMAIPIQNDMLKEIGGDGRSTPWPILSPRR